ncbi:OmpA family protein [Kordia jejudonensis]|uniref:OmpA family protein n=1 Tax=Kordia jejudonensis TaxID=1348245 RepID=UPI0006293E8E|nr:OmpA family protein [Kordia jejudonensis]
MKLKKTLLIIILLVFIKLSYAQQSESLSELNKRIKFSSYKSLDLDKGSHKILDLVSQIIKKNDASYLIESHSCMKGKNETNLIKTQKRAEIIKKELIKRGIENSRLVAVGYGETKRIYICTTRVCDLQNERIEIINID